MKDIHSSPLRASYGCLSWVIGVEGGGWGGVEGGGWGVGVGGGGRGIDHELSGVHCINIFIDSA